MHSGRKIALPRKGKKQSLLFSLRKNDGAADRESGELSSEVGGGECVN
jgi:hypothetical protein